MVVRMRPREHRTNRILAEIAGLVCGADFVRIALRDDANLESVGGMRFEFLDAAARNIGSVVQPRDAVVAARAINLERGDVLVARDDRAASRAKLFSSDALIIALSSRRPGTRASAASVRRWTSA